MPITNSSVVIPVEYSTQILRGVLGKSKALELGYRLPNMRGKTYKLNVLNYLPVANWVKNTVQANTPDEIKRKPVSRLAWEGVDVEAEEIAVIIPVAINTLRDLEGNAIALVPEISEQAIGAFQQVIDASVFFGTNAPYQNYNGIVADATTAGATVAWNGQSGVSFYQAINSAMTYVENSGYLPDAILGAPSLLGAFRGSITSMGVVSADQGEIGALPRHIDLTGGFNTGSAFAIVGDFKRGLVYSVREEMELRVLYEATIKDGDVEYNLAQQDMVAFRFTMRLGFAIANPVNRLSGVLSSDGKTIERGSTSYPFAVITKAQASA